MALEDVVSERKSLDVCENLLCGFNEAAFAPHHLAYSSSMKGPAFHLSQGQSSTTLLPHACPLFTHVLSCLYSIHEDFSQDGSLGKHSIEYGSPIKLGGHSLPVFGSVSPGLLAVSFRDLGNVGRVEGPLEKGK